MRVDRARVRNHRLRVPGMGISAGGFRRRVRPPRCSGRRAAAPDRGVRALSQPTIDHRGPQFASIARDALAGLQQIFQTSAAVVIYPSSGTGAWEAALVNTLSPGDTILMFETGYFAALWRSMA